MTLCSPGMHCAAPPGYVDVLVIGESHFDANPSLRCALSVLRAPGVRIVNASDSTARCQLAGVNSPRLPTLLDTSLAILSPFSVR